MMGGAAVGLSRAQVDLAVSSAVEDVKESLRDDLNQELRASLELEIGDSLRESVSFRNWIIFPLIERYTGNACTELETTQRQVVRSKKTLCFWSSPSDTFPVLPGAISTG